MPAPTPATAADDALALGFRFTVHFLTPGGPANEADIRFSKVSGLARETKTNQVEEGGQNLYAHQLPDRIEQGKLVLERGLVTGSRLNDDLGRMFERFRFAPVNVLITLLDEAQQPITGWMFLDAYPVRWSTSDLDAAQDAIVLDTLELTYTRMQTMKL